ncbi:MAG: hypothetical protein ACYDHY_15970 [Acidiferrobacterales bacterium]
MSLTRAFEITEEDIKNVLRTHAQRIVNPDGESFDTKAMKVYAELSDSDLARAAQAALESGTEMDEQTQGACLAIEAILVERGILNPVRQLRLGKVKRGVSLVINVPDFFRDQGFVSWLNNKTPKFTWHQGGTPHEYSDVVVLVDPTFTGEGSDSDMPAHLWKQIIDECRRQFPDISGMTAPVMVRLTNV